MEYHVSRKGIRKKCIRDLISPLFDRSMSLKDLCIKTEKMGGGGGADSGTSLLGPHL